jgi:hypothetical protein
MAAIAKIKKDLAWRSVTGVPMSQIVITRQQAEELVAEIERLQACTHKSRLLRQSLAAAKRVRIATNV